MSVIETETDLREAYAAPSEMVQKKILHRLDKHARAFIALSPFVVLATHGPDGADCSPRGDAPGFVLVERSSRTNGSKRAQSNFGLKASSRRTK